MISLFEQLLSRGEILDITGKTPFFLDDPESLWCILEGEIHVYVTSRSGEEQTGGRDHLFSLRRGQALFGVETGFFGTSMGLLASGVPGTRVLRISRKDLLREAERSGYAEAASLIDIFLDGLGRGIVKDIVPLPRIRQIIASGDSELQPDQAGGTEHLLWGKLKKGRALFTGTEDLSPESGFFALPSCCWIMPLEECSLETRSTEELLKEGSLSAAFDRFCETLFSSLAMNARLRAADDLGELRQMQRSRNRALTSGFETLASALAGKSRQTARSREETPLRRACAAISASLGTELSPPAEGVLEESIPDIARSANLRIRRVTLSGSWWQSDGAPLLAFREGIPLALLPTGRGEYRVVEEKGSFSVTENLAASLDPEAYHFYKPLPAKPLKGLDLLRFGLGDSRKDLFFTFLVGIALAILGLFPPEINGIIFSEVIPQAERGRMVQLFAILIALGVSSALLRFAQGIAFLRTECVLDHSVSVGIWDRILRLPVDFFRTTTSGELASRALGLYMLRNVASLAVKTLLVESIFVIFYVGQSFWYDWKLGLTGLGCLALQGLLMIGVNLLQLRYQRRMATLQNRLSSLTFQILTGIAKIRIAGAEERSFSRWANLFGSQRSSSTRARSLENGLNTATAFFSGITSMAILYALIRWSASDGSYDTGRFMAFWTAFAALQGSFLQVINSTTTALNVLPLVENLKPLLETEPETGERKSDPGTITGRIDLDRVTFRYRSDGPPVIRDLSFSVKPGEFVAVVGPSGAGKSTLIRLLLGFDRPESGGVFFDSKDLGDLDLKKLREQIGVVLQGGGLLPGDIASNVRCSRPLSLAQVEEALARAGMAEDLAEMPMGVHTVITEGANTISGGQKQRLLIARALAGNPKVLLFDEATSALDNRTQELVSQSLENIEATRIVVAHRLSTVMGADRILVMQQGQLVEEGTYRELFARGGLFTELARRQMV